MEERARLTGEEAERLRHRLCILSDGVAHGRRPEASVTLWENGEYRTVFVRVRKVDWPGRRLLVDRDRADAPEAIPFDDILTVHSAVIELLESPDGLLDGIE